MKAVVVEDSRLAREGLIRMLRDFPQIEVVGQADHPSTALPLIAQTRPEVVFLDIHMPGASGFDLLEQLDYLPRVIFTTAYAEHAIRSFDYNTIDYLLKPISPERLALAVNKLAAVPEQEEVARPALEINSKLFIKDGDKCHLVSLEAIDFFESCKNYVRVFFGAHSAYVKKSLNSVEERLPRSYFFRANRQYIVNLQAIVGIGELLNEGYEITMRNGTRLAISRRNAAELKELLSL